VIKTDFNEIYPGYQLISSVIGEGDSEVQYVHIKFKKTENDTIYEDVWQYWKTNNGWINRYKLLEKDLKKFFFDFLDSTNYSFIDFSEYHNKDWDKLIFLVPYSIPEFIRDSCNIKNILEIDQIKIETRDDISLVILTKNDLIIDYFTCPRKFDFSNVYRSCGYDKGKTKFLIHKRFESDSNDTTYIFK